MPHRNFGLKAVLIVALKIENADRKDYQDLIEFMLNHKLNELPGARLQPYLDACSKALLRQHPQLRDVEIPSQAHTFSVDILVRLQQPRLKANWKVDQLSSQAIDKLMER